MRKWMVIAVLALVLIVVVVGCAKPAPAPTPTPVPAPAPAPAPAPESAAEFYKGKLVTLNVGTTPGGGADTMARMIAPYLEQHLGGTVAVQNMAGAGGKTCFNYVYSSAKRDGTEILLNQGYSSLSPEVLGAEGVNYKSKEFTWLGGLSQGYSVILVAANSPYKTVADLQAAKGLTSGGTGIGTGLTDSTAGLVEVLGLDCKIVAGYAGSKETALATIQGELDFSVNSGTVAGPFIASGDMRPLAVYFYERVESLPDVPTVKEVLGSKLTGDLALVHDYGLDLRKIMYALSAPPAIPADRAAFLREAVTKQIHQNPQMPAELAKIRGFPSFESVENIEKIVDFWLALSPEKVKMLKEVMTVKHIK